MNDGKSEKTTVRCPRCKRFMFSIVITMDPMPSGNIGEICDLLCTNRRCRYKGNVAIGLTDVGGEKTKQGD